MLEELSITKMMSTGRRTTVGDVLPPKQSGASQATSSIAMAQLSSPEHSGMAPAPGGFTMTCRVPSTTPSQSVSGTEMHSPGGTATLVVHVTMSPPSKSGVADANWAALSGKWTMVTPGG